MGVSNLHVKSQLQWSFYVSKQAEKNITHLETMLLGTSSGPNIGQCQVRHSMAKRLK